MCWLSRGRVNDRTPLDCLQPGRGVTLTSKHWTEESTPSTAWESTPWSPWPPVTSVSPFKVERDWRRRRAVRLPTRRCSLLLVLRRTGSGCLSALTQIPTTVSILGLVTSIVTWGIDLMYKRLEFCTECDHCVYDTYLYTYELLSTWFWRITEYDDCVYDTYLYTYGWLSIGFWPTYKRLSMLFFWPKYQLLSIEFLP